MKVAIEKAAHTIKYRHNELNSLSCIKAQQPIRWSGSELGEGRRAKFASPFGLGVLLQLCGHRMRRSKDTVRFYRGMRATTCAG